MPFDFIIRLLSVLESRELSVYLIGGKQAVLKKAESNVCQTFPHLHIIGRHIGHFKKHKEPTILEAIRKSAPALLLVGKEVHGGELWIHRHTDKMGTGIRLWCSDIFAVFSNRKHHPSWYFFDHGLEWITHCFQNPLYSFRIFPYVYLKLLLLFHKLFRKDQKD
jgi:N-acetylglucosaminyldiphosphoundecaprenol N-acetyl-beta-D-mannosaminyltransferase